MTNAQETKYKETITQLRSQLRETQANAENEVREQLEAQSLRAEKAEFKVASLLLAFDQVRHAVTNASLGLSHNGLVPHTSSILEVHES